LAASLTNPTPMWKMKQSKNAIPVVTIGYYAFAFGILVYCGYQNITLNGTDLTLMIATAGTVTAAALTGKASDQN
jgi:hypothetical protein